MPKLSMKQLYLHIGHGKTGTSSMQTLLAMCHEKLKLYGVLYPRHPSFQAAKKGYISSGNISAHDHSHDWMTSQVLPVLQTEASYAKYIFSSEHMFLHMTPLFSYIDRCPGEIEVIVVLCVRDPLDLAASGYMQSVKRHGESCSFDEFIQARDFTHGYIQRTLDLLNKFDAYGIRCSLLNYSRLGPSVCQAIAESMGILDIVSDELHGLGTVNRSLTRDEAQLVLFVNSIFGPQAGSLTSDRLVNLLPDLKAELPSLTPAVYEQFKANLEPMLRKINNLLPLDSQLSISDSNCIREYSNICMLSDIQAEICKQALVEWFKSTYASSTSDQAGEIKRASNDEGIVKLLKSLKMKNKRLRSKLKLLRARRLSLKRLLRL